MTEPAIVQGPVGMKRREGRARRNAGAGLLVVLASMALAVPRLAAQDPEEVEPRKFQGLTVEQILALPDKDRVAHMKKLNLQEQIEVGVAIQGELLKRQLGRGSPELKPRDPKAGEPDDAANPRGSPRRPLPWGQAPDPDDPANREKLAEARKAFAENRIQDAQRLFAGLVSLYPVAGYYHAETMLILGEIGAAPGRRRSSGGSAVVGAYRTLVSAWLRDEEPWEKEFKSGMKVSRFEPLIQALKSAMEPVRSKEAWPDGDPRWRDADLRFVDWAIAEGELAAAKEMISADGQSAVGKVRMAALELRLGRALGGPEGVNTLRRVANRLRSAAESREDLPAAVRADAWYQEGLAHLALAACERRDTSAAARSTPSPGGRSGGGRRNSRNPPPTPAAPSPPAAARMSNNERRELDEAEMCLRNALGQRGDHLDACVALADCLAARGELDRARRTLEQRAQELPNHPVILYHMALLQDRADDAGTAVKTVASAAAHSRDPAVIWRAYALEMEAREKPALALHALRQAAAASPKDGTLWHQVGLKAQLCGEVDAAAAAFGRAIEAGHDDVATRVLLGHSLSMLDRLADAQAAYAGAAAKDRNSPMAWQALRIHFQQKRETDPSTVQFAGLQLTQFSEKTGESWPYHCEMGHLQVLGGNLNPAAKHFARAYELQRAQAGETRRSLAAAADSHEVDASLVRVVDLAGSRWQDFVDELLVVSPGLTQVAQLRNGRIVEEQRQQRERERELARAAAARDNGVFWRNLMRRPAGGGSPNGAFLRAERSAYEAAADVERDFRNKTWGNAAAMGVNILDW